MDMPTPEDPLGPQSEEESILGTPASGLYHGPYTRYLKDYERDNRGTTENAWTLRYWHSLNYPGVPIAGLWPIRIEYPGTDTVAE